jgi:hypothetical protein
MDSLSAHYLERIKTLQEISVQIEPLRDKDPMVQSMIRQLENEIAQYNMKIDRIKSKYGTVLCIQCGLYIERENTSPLNGSAQICAGCIKTLAGMSVSSEFESGRMPEGTIKQLATSDKDPLKTFKETGLLRKSGRYWLIHDLMWELYFKVKYEKKLPPGAN